MASPTSESNLYPSIMDSEGAMSAATPAEPAGEGVGARPRRLIPLTFEWPRRKEWIGIFKAMAIALAAYFIIFGSIAFIASHWSGSSQTQKQDDAQPCDTIHLATVCGGYRSTRDFYVLLKSILFHRRAYKINYHLFVDNISSKILTRLFEAWQVPGLSIVFHNVTKYEKDISWIPNLHYSNRYGLLKLLIPSIMAGKGVTEVMILDTDMLVLGDLRLVWKRFSDLHQSRAFLGLVENQSDWYLSKKESSSNHIRPIVWPAKGRGYNTGLILIDVARAIRQNWDELWRGVAETELVALLSTSLADQDIYNAVIKKHSHIVYNLPCHHNLQLNNHTDIDETCYNYQVEEINIVHWNSPQKRSTNNKMADYFKAWYTTFQDWNVKLLERDRCPKKKMGYYEKSLSEIKEDNIRHMQVMESFDDSCYYYKPRPKDSLRVFPYYNDYEIDSQKSMITIVVHLSMDRFRAFEELATRWSGPISAAIYLADGETSLLDDSIRESSALAGRKNIGYHLVYKVLGWHYPINKMRNIALGNVITPYVFLVDVDFLPSKDLQTYLQQAINKLPHSSDKGPLDKRALVIPAFENQQYKFNFPETKAELVKELEQGTISTFRDHIWAAGQESTDYTKWKQATQSYKVEWKPDYEPFIVTGRNVTKYDERFIGFGWNKVAHIMKLAASSYEFLVLPEAFIVHQNHAPSREIDLYRRDHDYKKCITDLKETVRSELLREYPTFRVPYVPYWKYSEF